MKTSVRFDTVESSMMRKHSETSRDTPKENIEVRFLGSGDAFGSGGRFQTCISVKTSKTHFVVDCGASSLIAMRKFGIRPNDIDMIFLTHLHADHFAGVPFFLLDARLVSRRSKPLTIAGPLGTKWRLREVMEAMFRNSSKAEQAFSLLVVELTPGSPQAFEGTKVTGFLVEHSSGDSPLALRIECAGKVISYTGDTEWTQSLIPATHQADLLIAEAYFFEKKVRYHLDFQTLTAHMDELRPKRLIVTHMSEDMLARLDRLTCEYAEDGKTVQI